jgi:hypothetical protein
MRTINFAFNFSPVQYILNAFLSDIICVIVHKKQNAGPHDKGTSTTLQAEAFGIGSTSQKWPGLLWNSRFTAALPKFVTGTCHQKDEFGA